MFGGKELAKLRLQKELLVARSEADRLILMLEWERLRSGPFWQREITRGLVNHPTLTAALGAGAGFLVLKMLGRPGGWLRWIGRITGAGSTLLSLWKALQSK